MKVIPENRKSIFFLSILGWTIAVTIGLMGAFFLKKTHLNLMIAAQIVLGIIGFAGGLNHALLMRLVYKKTSWTYAFLLGLIWSMSCIGAVTPLFFTLGTELKMATLSFYSFATFGAVGAFATGWVTNAPYRGVFSIKTSACAVIWAFGLGLAAVTSDILGTGLQTILPEGIAWAVACGIFAVLVGLTGGFSITYPSETSRVNRQDDRLSVKPSHVRSTFSKKANPVLYLFLLTAPFYVNDFTNIFIRDWRLWLFLNTIIVKLFPLLFVFRLIQSRRLQGKDLGLTVQHVVPFMTVFFIATVAGLFILQNGKLFLNHFPGYPPLAMVPDIKSSVWRCIDYTIGLLLVGVVEELVFRGFLFTFFSRYTRNPLIITALSSIAFGCIHWSLGLHSVIITSTVGAIYMLLYLRTHSLPPIMLSHAVLNFIELTNIIPKSIFSFF